MTQTEFLFPYTDSKVIKINIIDAIKNIKKLEWKTGNFQKQSWGNSRHKIGPYVGRIKPSFAHFLLKHLSKENDIILDPFCGIGTIALEGALLGRDTIGFDINPYSLSIAKAKTDSNKSIDELIRVVDKVKIDTSKISLDKIPEWVKEYYNLDTLKEIIFLLDYFKKQRHYFIYGCLLAISQGHRPGHLSKPCAWTLPYKPKPDDLGEYREVKPRLIAKIQRNLKDNNNLIGSMTIKKQDSRKLPLENCTIDVVCSSPPYYNTLDYINSHRLRLAVMGVYEENETKKLKEKTIQHYKTYIKDMSKVIKEIYRVLKKDGICCFVLGDHFRGKEIINTAAEISKILLQYNFVILDCIQDTIPINKSVQKTTLNVKFERILVAKKI